jgi:hypothetical protein
MRKFLFLTLGFAMLIPASYADNSANYVVTINGKSVDVNLGQDYSVTSPKGEKLTVRVAKKEIGTHDGELFSFRHKSEQGVTSEEIGDGVRQTMSASALGTVILFQEYTTRNPETLVDFMLQEVTKDDTEAGYELETKPVTRKIGGGITLKGVEAVVSGNGQVTTYTILAYGKKNQGVLIMTVMDRDNMKSDSGMMELLWDSLRFKF